MRIASKGEPLSTGGMSRIRRDLISPLLVNRIDRACVYDESYPLTDRRATEDSDDLTGRATVVGYGKHVTSVGAKGRAKQVTTRASRDDDE